MSVLENGKSLSFVYVVFRRNVIDVFVFGFFEMFILNVKFYAALWQAFITAKWYDNMNK